MGAVNELRDQTNIVKSEAAKLGIEIGAFLVAASIGLGALEAILLAAGMLETAVVPLLYGGEGLQTKIDACETAYFQYDN